MKTIKKFIFMLATLTILFSGGCSKDFLDIKPAGKIDENSFFTDVKNMDAMVSGVYNTFQYKDNCDVFDYFRWWLGSVPSDEAECGGNTPTAWGMGYSFDDLTYTADLGIIQDVYGTMYNGISRASEVIEKLPAAKKLDGADINKINIRLGETYFLRAACNFVLTRAFGGVPVVDHVLLPSEYKTIPRGTIKDVFNLMEKDLKTAIQYLPLESQISTKEKGRASKGAAQSLLAKMYVYESSYFSYYGTNDVRMGAVQNRWKEAYDLCLEVINSGEYELVGTKGDTYNTFWSTATNGYRYLFTVEGNNNKESIFAIQHIFDTGYNNSMGTALNTFVGARALYIDKEHTISSGEDGHNWGFWVPTHKLDNLYDPLDARRKVTIGRGPDPITGYPGDSVYGQFNGKSGWYTIVPTASPATGLETFKYEIGPYLGMIKGNWQGNSQNMYYLRYADVVLLASESAMMLNDQPNALKYFNMIRERARNCGDGVHPVDLTGVVAKKEIMDERLLEFAIEGERFFDLVRWKEAYNAINGSRMEWWDFGGYNSTYNSLMYIEPKNDFFPLPSLEVSKNSALKQYAGW
jgi:starch-binding outer membrane protein, SusD/RagB family